MDFRDAQYAKLNQMSAGLAGAVQGQGIISSLGAQFQNAQTPRPLGPVPDQLSYIEKSVYELNSILYRAQESLVGPYPADATQAANPVESVNGSLSRISSALDVAIKLASGIDQQLSR